MTRAAVLALALAAGGCATFEDPTRIRDLRVIAVQATPPDQVIDIDPTGIPTFEEVLFQLQPIEVCAVVADPGKARGLVWSMEACGVTEDSGGRCDPAFTRFSLEDDDFYLEDPEACLPEGFEPRRCLACARLIPWDPASGALNVDLATLLLELLEHDPTRGLTGLEVGVSFRIGGEDAPRDDDVYAVKSIRVSPRIPAERRANNNPYIWHLLLGAGGIATEIQSGRCIEGVSPADDKVAPGQTVTLYPVEPDGVREVFTVPTLDGHFEEFTEVLTYQWLAGNGSFSDAVTGGPPDVFGTEQLTGTEWTAPTNVGSGTVVPIWMVQRDQRLGVQWQETCIHVNP